MATRIKNKENQQRQNIGKSLIITNLPILQRVQMNQIQMIIRVINIKNIKENTAKKDHMINIINIKGKRNQKIQIGQGHLIDLEGQGHHLVTIALMMKDNQNCPRGKETNIDTDQGLHQGLQIDLEEGQGHHFIPIAMIMKDTQNCLGGKKINIDTDQGHHHHRILVVHQRWRTGTISNTRKK